MKTIALILCALVAPALFAQSADLVLTKSDSPDPVVKNTNLTYTVSVLNNGPSAATNVIVTDELDGNVSFVSAEQTAGPTATMSTPGDVGGTFTATIPTLAAGETATFVIVVNVFALFDMGGGTISNEATVTSATPDPNPANNTATTTTTTQTVADLVVTKTARPGPVVPGGLLTYTLSIANEGPSMEYNVALIDDLPANTTFVSAVQTGGQFFSMVTPAPGATGTFSAGSATIANFFGFFGPGQFATFDLTVRVDGDVPVGTSIPNSVRAQPMNPARDPDLTNNTATTTVVVEAEILIPTLSEWMMLLLAVGLAAAAFVRIRVS